MSGLRLRRAVRALLLDADDRILLARFEFPASGDREARTVWVPPGGGLEEGEEDAEGIRRELREELGFDLEGDPGPAVWTRTHVVPLFSGLFDGQTERYFVVRTEAFEPKPHLTWAELEAELVFELRWWTQQELRESRAQFAPSRLPTLLGDLLRHGAPADPVDVGV